MSYLDRLRKQSDAVETPEETGRKIVRDVIPPGPPIRLTKKPSHTETPAPKQPSDQILRPVPSPVTPRKALPPVPDNPMEPPMGIPEAAPAPDARTILDVELPVHTWEPSGSKKRQRIRRASIVGVSLVLVAIFVLPTFIFPKFSIVIYPKIEAQDIGTLNLTLDMSITTSDPTGKRIPGLAITLEKTIAEDFEATGKKFVQAKAQGTVTLYNAFDSSPQRLVANTRLEDASGKIFRLLSAVTVPGAKVEGGRVQATSITTTVIADQPGESYNIGPTEFRIPGFRGTAKFDGFSAKSETAFRGGFVGESKIATLDDIKRGSEALTKRVIDELRAELDQKIPADNDFAAPPSGREAMIVNIIAPKPGDPGDRFTITVHGKGRLLALKTSDLASLVVTLLRPPDEISPEKTPTRQEGIQITIAGFDSVKSEARLTASGTLRYYHEPSVTDIAHVLRTSTPRKAEAYLRGRDEIDSFRLKRFPPWLWFIPARSSGLNVSVVPPA